MQKEREDKSKATSNNIELSVDLYTNIFSQQHSLHLSASHRPCPISLPFPSFPFFFFLLCSFTRPKKAKGNQRRCESCNPLTPLRFRPTPIIILWRNRYECRRARRRRSQRRRRPVGRSDRPTMRGIRGIWQEERKELACGYEGQKVVTRLV